MGAARESRKTMRTSRPPVWFESRSMRERVSVRAVVIHAGWERRRIRMRRLGGSFDRELLDGTVSSRSCVSRRFSIGAVKRLQSTDGLGQTS